jgi:hypothetical protein
MEPLVIPAHLAGRRRDNRSSRTRYLDAAAELEARWRSALM